MLEAGGDAAPQGVKALGQRIDAIAEGRRLRFGRGAVVSAREGTRRCDRGAVEEAHSASLCRALARGVDRAGIDEVRALLRRETGFGSSSSTASPFNLVDALLVAVAEEADARARKVRAQECRVLAGSAPASPCTAARRACRRAPAPRRSSSSHDSAAGLQALGGTGGASVRRVRLQESLFSFGGAAAEVEPATGDQVVVAGDGHGAAPAQHFHAFVRIGVVADDVAEADDALHAAVLRAARGPRSIASRLP